MEKFLFLQYPQCGTCKKARKWLDDNGIDYEIRPIVEERPSSGELREWISQSGLPVRKFFNTCGVLYKEMQLKDKLPSMSEEEQIELLSTDGKLVKRPLLIGRGKVLVGFKAEEWEKLK